MTDSQLVTGILDNDECAWRHICRNMKTGFMAKVYSMNLHGKLVPQDLEDVFQESCVILMQTVKEDVSEESDFWQGTIVYLQLATNKEINPAEVVANRTNVSAQYNETFLTDNDLEELWLHLILGSTERI